ncbi:MAG: hypothetical protein KDJ19_06105 [Hyphomicrobiaceae bacterium]|nr:hypothetical protein [Hyphomicrobiaceae bacterium]MCC0023066.1 hypothetical protein [Hyphomicrobiaceae bacterium]
MSAIILRILIYVLVFAAIWFGVRRIWSDWQNKFRADDEAQHQRDLHERKRPDVVDLKRDKDGVFRPGDDDRR